MREGGREIDRERERKRDGLKKRYFKIESTIRLQSDNLNNIEY